MDLCPRNSGLDQH